MAWLQTLHHLLNPTKIERVAATIAIENQHRVWQRTVELGTGMSRGQAKGYIRARAATIVQQAVAQYMHDEQISSDSLRERLVEQTTVALVTNLTPELLKAPSRALRRAA